jgi:hypothetical protein
MPCSPIEIHDFGGMYCLAGFLLGLFFDLMTGCASSWNISEFIPTCTTWQHRRWYTSLQSNLLKSSVSFFLSTGISPHNTASYKEMSHFVDPSNPVNYWSFKDRCTAYMLFWNHFCFLLTVIWFHYLPICSSNSFIVNQHFVTWVSTVNMKPLFSVFIIFPYFAKCWLTQQLKYVPPETLCSHFHRAWTPPPPTPIGKVKLSMLN